MKILYIAEKAKVGRAIAEALGGFKKNQGYLEGNVKGDDVFITWCSGHMMQLYNPSDYDEKYKKWNFETLPFCFLPYKKKVSSDKQKKAQLKVIEKLLSKADMVVNAGDPDDEGQLIVDDLVRFYGFKKPVKRVLINDNNKKMVLKAIDGMVDNKKFEPMGYQAEARSVADQTLGLNFTRAYTLLNRRKGGDGVVSAGRVQSAILGLIVRRTVAFNSHTVSYYYDLIGDININGNQFKAKFKPSKQFIENNASAFDDKGRILDADLAKKIVDACSGAGAVVNKAVTSDKKTPPPLPYNLIKLQQKASKLFNYDPDEVMKITQSLKDKDYITYNRTDCQYLNDAHFNDASGVLSTIKNNVPDLKTGVDGADDKLKGRVFDDSKTTAHHAIIPSENNFNIDSLSAKEKNIYELIAKSYVVQFYPDYEYQETSVIIDVSDDKYTFETTSKKPINQGWKSFNNDDDDEEDEEHEEDSKTDLSVLKDGQNGSCLTCEASKKKTKPRPLYTMSSLLGDLTSASKYIKNAKLAKILKDRDKDKKGESGGIGTPATRDSIIKLLFDRGFIEKKGKSIISTAQGEELYNLLSDVMKYPDLSALWVEKFKDIKTQDDVIDFISYVKKSNIDPEINKIKANLPEPVAKATAETAPCPVCKTHDMVKRKGKFGVYWGCLGYRDEDDPCKNIMNDENGKPVPKKPKHDLSEFDCKKCGSKLIHRKGKSKKPKKEYSFFGCSAYPKCDAVYNEKGGKPVYDKD